MDRRPPTSTLFPYTTLFRSQDQTPDLRFSTAQAGVSDPGNQTEAVGDADAVHASTLGLKNLHRVSDMLLEARRSEEHTSELQSQSNLVCRLLLEKKNNAQNT